MRGKGEWGQRKRNGLEEEDSWVKNEECEIREGGEWN